MCVLQLCTFSQTLALLVVTASFTAKYRSTTFIFLNGQVLPAFGSIGNYKSWLVQTSLVITALQAYANKNVIDELVKRPSRFYEINVTSLSRKRSAVIIFDHLWV